jgi:hypothetical protein
MSISSLSSSASTTAPVTPKEIAKEPVVKIEKVQDNLSTEEYVKKYFSDVPVLIEVAKCESRFRQREGGQVLRGEVNEFDRGVMQINEMYHLERAKRLGLNIHTLEGNLSYARYLYENEGLQPWISSSPCWKKTQAYADYVDHSELAKK